MIFKAISCCGLLLLASGCTSSKPTLPSPAPADIAPARTVVKPDFRSHGEVLMVNTQARFVVVGFPPGAVPMAERHLNVYRNGLSIGQIKVTGPQQENNTVADIVTGVIQVGDEVRDK